MSDILLSTDPLLFALDRQLKSRQAHVLVIFDVWLFGDGSLRGVHHRGERFRVVVEDHFKLPGAACLVE